MRGRRSSGVRHCVTLAVQRETRVVLYFVGALMWGGPAQSAQQSIGDSLLRP